MEPRIMVKPYRRAVIVAGSVILSTLAMALGGCTVEVAPAHERVYAPPPPAYEPPPPVAEAPPPPPAYEPPPADVEATYQTDLSPYGGWVTVGTYGRCWRPRGVAVGWQPYTVGHWVDTDQGWAWEADAAEANWGVVTYHYGRWYQDSSYGWVWVPGTTWAPAWVAWRSGGGYCGWAPLSPQCGFGVNISVGLVDRYVPREHYVFVDEHYMGQPVIYNHVVRNNVTIINRTTNITNITVVNNRVVNRGVSVEEVQRVSGRRVERVQMATATSPDEARRLRAEGKPVAYQPENIQRADVTYRQRVEARTTETHTAERDRSNDRSTAAQDAERTRTQRRTQQSQQSTEAERQRAADRTKASAQSTEAEKQRTADRAKASVQSTEAEKQRAAEREKGAAQTDEAAKGRANSKEQQSAADRQSAHDRAVARDKAAAAGKAPPSEKAAPDEKSRAPQAKPDDKRDPQDNPQK
jgi:hypothetical protein